MGRALHAYQVSLEAALGQPVVHALAVVEGDEVVPPAEETAPAEPEAAPDEDAAPVDDDD